jgi:hypothetical protein
VPRTERRLRPMECLRLRMHYLMTDEDMTAIGRGFNTTKQTVSRNTTGKGLSRDKAKIDLFPQVVRLWELWLEDTKNVVLLSPVELLLVISAVLAAAEYKDAVRLRDVMPRVAEWWRMTLKASPL